MEERIMATVFDVAKYVLKQLGSITTMKLQKLVYYCQAWSLGWDGKPLFGENFEAWANGSVCPELFHKHQGCLSLMKNYLRIYQIISFQRMN